MENDEKKYEDVIKALKGLQEVKAPANFEADLQRRINQEKFSKEEKKSFWQNILLPSRLIPSLGLVAIAVTIFFVVEANSEKIDNPFLIEPRVRTDLIEIKDYEQLKEEQEKVLAKSKSTEKRKNIPEEKSNRNELKSLSDEKVSASKKDQAVDKLMSEQNLAADKGKSEGIIPLPESTFVELSDSLKTTVPPEVSSEITGGEKIAKEELNFRQVQLSEKEQKIVNELKMKVQSLEKTDKLQK